jgi:NTE family protein/lysophospholipid hydrolase
VSANLTQAELVVHDCGSLRDAVRASCALPGILPPAVKAGDLLVDGGVLDNLPGGVMRTAIGCRVIASDVSPRRDLAVDPGLQALPANRELMLHRHHAGHIPGMLQIFVRTLMLGSLHATHQVKADADVYLHTPTDEYGIFEFEAIDKLIEAGHRYALPLLAGWKERALAV